MKDLRAFLEVMGKDKELSEKVRGAKDVKEMVKIAKEEGYSVTEDEMNDILMEAVAGGKFNLDSFIAGTVGSLGKGLEAMGQAKSQGASWKDAATAGGITAGAGALQSAAQSIGSQSGN